MCVAHQKHSSSLNHKHPLDAQAWQQTIDANSLDKSDRRLAQLPFMALLQAHTLQTHHSMVYQQPTRLVAAGPGL